MVKNTYFLLFLSLSKVQSIDLRLQWEALMDEIPPGHPDYEKAKAAAVPFNLSREKQERERKKNLLSHLYAKCYGSKKRYRCPNGMYVGMKINKARTDCEFQPCPRECPIDLTRICANTKLPQERDIYNNCEFLPCGSQPVWDKNRVCDTDEAPCFHGDWVSRNASLNCEFNPCGDTKVFRSRRLSFFDVAWKLGKLSKKGYYRPISKISSNAKAYMKNPRVYAQLAKRRRAAHENFYTRKVKKVIQGTLGYSHPII